MLSILETVITNYYIILLWKGSQGANDGITAMLS